MKLTPFQLEQWIETYRDAVRYNLAMSTGPKWTLDELRQVMTETERDAFDRAALAYCPGSGRKSLRAAIASMYDADPEEIQTFTGGAEALLSLFFLALEPGANVVVPWPSFPPFVSLPEALGPETRRYLLTQENGFAADAQEILSLCDARTKLILVNSPHNPSGAIVEEETVRALDAFASERGIALVVDEVYHPIYHGARRRSAGEYSRATVLGDFSKAFSLPGLRVGWLLERDPVRRAELANARGYWTVSNNTLGELLAEAATHHREAVWARTQAVSAKNLALLDAWCAAHEAQVEWLRPRGAMTAFPRFRDARDARPFCVSAAERGVLVVPGDCFGMPAHFRIGFGDETPGYADALGVLSDVLDGGGARQSRAV
jgi:aspartate/methionine/tyrosine aminotransferase